MKAAAAFAPRRRRIVVAAAASLALPAWVSGSRAAAAFPSRAVRIVVPYSVGVGPDVVARSVAERLSQRWEQPVLVDNKPGASGIVAFAEVRRTPADGHTLFLADTATLAMNPLLHASLPYDPAQDLAPLTLLFRATFLIWVGGDSRFRSLGSLLEAARARPRDVSYASLGNGHASQLAIESFARAAGVQLLHVPFKDTGALMTAVSSGAVDFTAFSFNTVAALHASGKLRALAVAAEKPLADHPDIPTLPQAGGPDVTMHPWAALVTLAGTPPAVQQQLQGDIADALAAADVRERAGQAGFEITPSTPQGVRDRVAADLAMYRPLLAEGRIERP